MTPERWEEIARLLKSGPISDNAVIEQLHCGKKTVAQVRRDLGLPRYRPPARTWGREDYERLSVPLRGGHRRWRGRFDAYGIPYANRSMTAYRLAFRVHHGREPVGRVQSTCTYKRCVAGEHLADRPMRQAIADGSLLTELPAGATFQGMDLVAIRRCLRGPEPWPELDLREARFAFRFSDPDMSAADLGRRLGLCAETIQRYRTKGVPKC
ncbi:hypothetical protein DI272_19220 [Streptomyces sp. Act143]|uniref:hypothetical protein n=1 Tax=Streptomyces sp. Act143 TaxID=2200760 RepID=UPI000D682C5F|nr:hypothetical protein [Streptomyces sp. Act143]PWI16062.1 hypothetical protein DI272_19220 [Streptomyces sp. Act143]